MNKQTIICLFSVLLLALCQSAAAEELVILVKFTNPSQFEPKQEKARFYLPAEIKFKDVLDKGGLELTYDESRSTYYVHKDFVLEPGETRSFKVTIQNVFVIEAGEIEFLQKQAQERLEALEGSEHYEQAEKIAERITRELEVIGQSQVSAGDADIAKKIEIYRVNIERLRQVRNTVLLMEDFESLVEEEVEQAKFPKNISFIVKVKNKSDTEPRKQRVKQYLAEGIRAEYMINLEGFEVHFDPEKRLYYLTKDVELEPGETKSFNITFEDRWLIREPKLGGYSQEAEDIAIELANTEFKERADFLMGEIGKNINMVKDLQNRKVSIRDKMAFFQDNTKRVEVIKQNILELRRMLEIIRERERQKRLEEILRRVFKEAAWKIIYGTIMLLGLISIMTYILWWGQTKQKQMEKYEEVE